MKNFLTTKNLLVIIVCLTICDLILIGFAGKFWVQHSMSFRVTLSDTGFNPSNLSIKTGDTVVFITERKSEFWPASDPHPVHGDYPSFDSKRPLSPVESWSFVFSKSGTWHYHDHLNTSFRGTIIVSGSSTQSSSVSTCSDTNCWDRQIEASLKNNGLESAFALVAQLYKDEPAYAGSCHNNVHKIGQAAYQLYRSHKDFSLPANTSYCGYAFYHGFMERLLATTRDYNEARQFCENIGTYMQEKTDKAKIACFHGIGHGLAEDGLTEKTGSAQAAVDPALQVCEKVGNDALEKELCATGVFNSLAINVNAGGTKLVISSSDPYGLCSQQAIDYQKKACYQEFATYALVLAHFKFGNAVKYVENIKEDNYAIPAMENLAASATLGEVLEREHDMIIKACHATQPRLQPACLSGIAGTLIEQSTPGKEYVSAFSFCHSALLTAQEKDNCFKTTLSLSKSLYPSGQYSQICQAADEKYRHYCQIF